MVTVVAEEGADLGDADTVADLFDAVRQPSFQQFLAALDQDPVRPAVLKKRKGTADPELERAQAALALRAKTLQATAILPAMNAVASDLHAVKEGLSDCRKILQKTVAYSCGKYDHLIRRISRTEDGQPAILLVKDKHIDLHNTALRKAELLAVQNSSASMDHKNEATAELTEIEEREKDGPMNVQYFGHMHGLQNMM